jgi:hypothetical protein
VEVGYAIRESHWAAKRRTFGFVAELRGFAASIKPETQIYDRIVRALREEPRMPKDPLAREQEMVVQLARHALTRTIEQYSPVGTDTLPIAAVAVSRMFADLINSFSGGADIVDVVNRQIEQSGYRLLRTERH